MVDIHPKRRRRKKKQDQNIMSASATQGGHKKPHGIKWPALLHRAAIINVKKSKV